MARCLYPERSNSSRKINVMILALSWFLGLFLGIYFFDICGAAISSMMNKAVYSSVSIAGTLIPFLLPFLFSVCLIYLGFTRLLVLISFCKAFLLAFVSCGLFGAFGNAGWLMYILFFFSDICFSSLLILYWLRHVSGKRFFRAIETILFLFAALVVASVDNLVISPFLQGVLLN